MAYFSRATVKSKLNISDTSFDSLIDNQWGPESDDEVDSKLEPYFSTPLSSPPDIVIIAANTRTISKYFEYNQDYVQAKYYYDSFLNIIDTYVKGVQADQSQEETPTFFVKTTGNYLADPSP